MADVNNHINYSLADIERYVQGKMNANDMHNLEHAALQDPFLADAIEGYSDADPATSKRHLAEIDSMLQVGDKQNAVVVVPRKKNTVWRIAASVIFLVGIASAGYFIFNNTNKEISLAKTESVSVNTFSDSAHTTMQHTIPALTDTAAFNYKNETTDSENKKEISADKKTNSMAIKVQPMHKKIPAPYTPSIDKNTERGDAQASAAMAMKAPQVILSGNVVDYNNRPVPNATIILADSTQILTDRDGNFNINTADSIATASVYALGYNPLSGIQLQRQDNRIILEENSSSLAEVVVTSLGKARKKSADTTASMPEGGWQSFQEYVYKKLNKKYDSTSLTNASINGELKLEFSIDDEGQPYDFKIISAPDSGLANNAISAIRQGPKWIGADKGKKTRVTVRY